MKPGLALGVLMVSGTIGLSPAQNLGLGTGSRTLSEDSSDAAEYRGDRSESAPPRKSQINRRLGLTGRKSPAFDAKQFEVRGKDLQNQFYEIGTPANPKTHSSEPATSGATVSIQKGGSRQWLLWVGVAGIAGASAGTVGFLMMQKAHPASAPPDIPLDLSDEP
ncbi:MAG: hypothetical protein M3Y08_03445 [Fibrobacterota bacterium]|nr:hypothetical protein [Fibrobacterota bacterium]